MLCADWVTKGKNDKNVPHLETTEVVLVPFNIVNNDYKKDSSVLYTFIPNKAFGQLLDNFIITKIIITLFIN